MADFPAINPIYAPSKKPDSSRNTLALGDGYQKSINFGLNSIKQEWSLEWIVDEEQAYEIDGFLQERADSAEVFNWRPPGEDVIYSWTCSEWNIARESFDLFTVNAKFVRAHELSVYELQPATATCVDMPGENCLDYGVLDGPVITGNAVVGETVSYNQCSNAYVEWRIVDNATGVYSVAASGIGVTTYVVTQAAAQPGKSLVAVNKCPEDNYRLEITSPPLTIFNPFAYTLVRVKFWYVRFSDGASYGTEANPFTGAWLETNVVRYISGNNNPTGSVCLTPNTGGPWRINLTAYKASDCSSSFAFATVLTYTDGTSSQYGETFIVGLSNIGAGAAAGIMNGYFEFSNNAGNPSAGPITRWNGIIL